MQVFIIPVLFLPRPISPTATGTGTLQDGLMDYPLGGRMNHIIAAINRLSLGISCLAETHTLPPSARRQP